ncbi:MAG TPA: helix-turn-helix domain-containing protein [Pseudomonas sp.]|nr:helix-turn-helix domain-containing protein [Pseudomonas sp.]
METVQQDSACKVPYTVMDTRGLPPPLAAKLWQESIEVMFDTRLRDTQGNGAYSRIKACMIGPLALGSAQIGPQTFDRPAAKIGRDGLDHLLLQFYVNGHCRERNNKLADDTQSGDLWITDLGQPLASEVSTAANISLILPRSLISPLLRQPDAHHQRIIKSHEPLSRLLRSHMHMLLQTAPDMTVTDAHAITRPTLELAAATLNGACHGQCEAGVVVGVRLQIARYIESRLADSGLSPRGIAQHFAISLRKLQYMFETEGGIAAFIQRTRLRHCRTMILDPALQQHSIEQLASQCGFTHPQSFSRTFRREFGMSPRSVRMLARQRAPIPEQDNWVHTSWHQWISQMR